MEIGGLTRELASDHLDVAAGLAHWPPAGAAAAAAAAAATAATLSNVNKGPARASGCQDEVALGRLERVAPIQ